VSHHLIGIDPTFNPTLDVKVLGKYLSPILHAVIVQSKAEGKSVLQISLSLNVNLRSVYDTLERWKTFGAVESISPTSPTSQEERIVLRAVERSPRIEYAK
jgi:hypothetical protein